jgi:hypothetical protein
MSTYYRVYFTPRNSRLTYGDEVEVTRFVKEQNAGQIRRGLDVTDYEVGAFFYDDVKLTLLNVNGYLNDESDVRSIFPFGRNKAKVRMEYTDSDGTTIVFNGLVSEEATRIDATKDEIELRVLSLDSVMRTVRVAGGTISTSSSIQAAILSILDQPEITAVLTVDEANINPAYDFDLDEPDELEDKSVRDAMNQLLLVSNSIMYIDADGAVIVTSRNEGTESILNLYGPYDLKRRQNIVDIKNYNLGTHRAFTAVKVNSTESSDEGYIEDYGYRQKRISAPYITDAVKEAAVGEALVAEFKTPKIELEVVVPTRVVRDLTLLARVSIDHPLRTKPAPDCFLPIIGQTTIGEAEMPLPYQYGSIAIPPEMGFKVIEIREDVRTFLTTLKLRQIGTESGDGYFTSSLCATVGYSVIGVSTICGTGDPGDAFNPARIGSAVIDYSEVAT